MVGGKLRLLTPLVVFFKSSPFFGGCGLNYMIHINIYTYITFIGLFLWSRRVVWIGFLLTAASGINISFRSWQAPRAIGARRWVNIHNGFPPRRLELTTKPLSGERGAWNLPKIGVRFRCPRGTSISGSSNQFFRGGFLVYCFYSSLYYFTLPVSWRSDGKSSSWSCISKKKRWISTAIS